MTALVNRAFAWCMYAVMVAAPSMAMAATCDQSASVEDKNKGLVEQAFERWAAGGTTFFNDILHDDVVWRIEGSGRSAGEFKGRDIFLERAVRPFATRLSTPVRPTAFKLFADGDHVIAHWKGSGIAKDGETYTNSYAWIFRMRDGKASEVAAFLDLAPYDDVLRRIPSQQ